MAVTLINSNLHLSDAQLLALGLVRQNQGYHVYYKGDGIKTNAYTFNLPSAIGVGNPTAAVATVLVGKNLEFSMTLRHFFLDETLRYKQSYQGQKRTATASSKQGKRTEVLATTNYVVTEGVHIIKAAVTRRGGLNIFVDDEPLLQGGKRQFGTLRALDINVAGITVYEAHFAYPGRASYAVFHANGLEMPKNPTMYPSSYIQFSGKPFEKKRPRIEIRYSFIQKDPEEIIYFRKEAAPVTEKIQVVFKVFEEHFSIWTSEGLEIVTATVFRAPSFFGIYEFVLDAMLVCVPTS
ncbi:uncharacterized protein LOC144106405 isoform X2 [Amblyomma americanum]